MSVINVSNLKTSLDVIDYDFIFDSFLSSNSTSYRFQTSTGNIVTLEGTGITTDLFDEPTSGNITSITVELAAGNPSAPDMVVTGFGSLNLATSPIIGLSPISLYSLFVDGNTTIIGPTSTGSGFFTGDFVQVSGGLLSGDDLTATGTFSNESLVIGGVGYVVNGATVNSGTLTFNGASYLVAGDSLQVEDESTVYGGDDSIIMTSATKGTELGANKIYLYGDVENAIGNSTVYGGDDFIDARAISDRSVEKVIIRGDAQTVGGSEGGIDSSTVIGGDDTIYGSATIDNYIVGDVDKIDFLAGFEGGNDVIYGGAGDDFLAGDVHPNNLATSEGGDDFIYSGGGFDQIFGGGGDDTIFLQGGGGTIFGDRDDDFFVIEKAGNYTIDGGGGFDSISFEESTVGVEIDMGDGTGAYGLAQGIKLKGIESVFGSTLGHDTINGNSLTKEIMTFGGNDKVYTGNGNSKSIDLGGGNDQLFVENSTRNTYDGGSGIDLISYKDASKAIAIDLNLGKGLSAGSSGDTIRGFEHAYGTNSYDDELKGTSYNNILKGFGGDDLINGRSGNDFVVGGGGNDVVKGGTGDDKVKGGGGADTVKGGGGADNVNGGGGADKVKGGGGNDVIKGGGGNDKIFGNSGDDVIKAGGGNDFIEGNRGDDILSGKSGADVFHFNKGDGDDVIMDFKNNVDTIEFDNYSASIDPFDNAAQVGNHVVFSFSNGDSVTVRNITIDALMDDVDWLG